MNSLYTLPVGHTLTATVVDGKGYVRRQDNPAIGGIVTNAAAAVYGPYMAAHVFETQGDVTVVIAEADVLPTADEKALLDNIPTEDPADDGVSVWNDGGALKVAGASA